MCHCVPVCFSWSVCCDCITVVLYRVCVFFKYFNHLFCCCLCFGCCLCFVVLDVLFFVYSVVVVAVMLCIVQCRCLSIRIL